MCGIVAAIAKRDVAEILLEGLSSLEYRGYDSAGILTIGDDNKVNLVKTIGKVAVLKDSLDLETQNGHIGIAHTRWATHGVPSKVNAHPHMYKNLALVHNGIIENYISIKQELQAKGHEFLGQSDSEVLVHFIYECVQLKNDIVKGFSYALSQIKGSYAIALVDTNAADTIYAARLGSPLVIGLGIGENFVASDVLALLPVTTRFIYLDEGEIAIVKRKEIEVFDLELNKKQKQEQKCDYDLDKVTLGSYRHFMQKEIFEQRQAIEDTLLGRILEDNKLSFNSINNLSECNLESIEHVEIIACGTSYHAGLVGKYFLEEYAHINTSVEIASEFRYRQAIIPKNSLFITISQSGETADTLAALRKAKAMGIKSLAICNVNGSSLVRESDFSFLTRAGIEVGVASTKAFTTQLCVLLLLTLMFAAKKHSLSDDKLNELILELKHLPKFVEEFLSFNDTIKTLATDFVDKKHCLFLGRGTMYPIALEGALKLKEISYIDAQGYAAGELKHGPIALVDEHMPIVVVAPDNNLADKLVSNIEEVKARGGMLYIFTSLDLMINDQQVKLIKMPKVPYILEPIVYTIPLQLLSYHVAVIKGTDVDKPRNLAKSVTVE